MASLRTIQRHERRHIQQHFSREYTPSVISEGVDTDELLQTRLDDDDDEADSSGDDDNNNSEDGCQAAGYGNDESDDELASGVDIASDESDRESEPDCCPDIWSIADAQTGTRRGPALEN